MSDQWYYKIELEKNVFTNGRLRKNISMVRQVLKNIDLNGLSCLDIGTQEAMIPVLLRKQGAKEVYAYDRFDFPDRIAKVKKAYNVDFNYLSGSLIEGLKSRLIKERGSEQFDVVVFSGVLYHLIDPLGGLARVRSLCKKGGICIIETSAFVSDDMVMYFNDKGKLYPQTNYFQVSIALLDYLVRLVQLEPIDFLFRIQKKNPKIARVTIVCRSNDTCTAESDDSWMNKQIIKRDFGQKDLHYDKLKSVDRKIDYKVFDKSNLVINPDTKAVDLYQTMINRPNSPGFKELTYLSLTDKY